MSLTDIKTKILNLFDKIGVGTVVGVTTAAVVIVCCTAAYLATHSDNTLPPDTNEQMASDAEDTLTEDELGFVIDDIPVTNLEIPYLEMGYNSLDEYWTDIEAKRAEADGMTDAVLAKYGSIFSDTELEQLYAAENKMENAVLMTDYDDALNAFNEIVNANKPKPVTKPATGNSGGGNYGGTVSSGGFNIPYNFKSAGILYDDDWRYSYYSSQVLYHYKTPQWTLGSDGIYRDSRGYVIVASDAHPQGTVLETDLWGTVVVEDCGVGRKDTLDVYVGF